MKTWKNLFPQIIDRNNVHKAIWNASKGKRKRNDVREVLDNEAFHIDAVINMLKNRAYRPSFNQTCIINEGTHRKLREIHKPNFKYDQIVHHALMQQLIPVFMKGMYEYVCGSVPGRGSHTVKKYIEKCITSDRKNTKYCCKMDIRHFFASVDHVILKELLYQKIKDDETLFLLDCVIDGYSDGLPLGNYTSPWFGNFMLQSLDHFIKEDLHVKYYVRYMDDMVIFGRNKKTLHSQRKAIEDYLNNKLNLEMKGNWQVFRFDYVDRKTGNHKGRDLDFLGFRFFRDRTIIRKSIMLRATRKAKRISKKGVLTAHDASSMISYMGWFTHTDSYNMYLERIKPYVDVKKLKKTVSAHERRINREQRMEKSRGLQREQAGRSGYQIKPDNSLSEPEHKESITDR